MYNNLIECLNECRKSEKGIYYIIDQENNSDFLSYQELYREAMKSLSYFHSRHIKEGEHLILVTTDNKIFMKGLWACLIGKLIVVPLAMNAKAEDAERLYKIVQKFEKASLVIDQVLYDQIGSKLQTVGNLRAVIITEEWIRCEDVVYDAFVQNLDNPDFSMNDRNELECTRKIYQDDIAMLQFSSGSTGTPKGVMLSHKNLICGVYEIAEGSAITAEDVFLSWLPLTHNMGLIGLHFTPIFACSDQVFMPAAMFVRNPLSWLINISRFRVSRIAGPNFAYRILIQLLKKQELPDLDLSCVKEVYNGSEPVSMQLMCDLYSELKKYRFQKEALYPVYGMAEATLAITFPKPSTVPESIFVDRRFLNIKDSVHILLDSGDSNAVEFVKLGYPLKYIQLKIMDEDRHDLDEGKVGVVWIKGDAVFQGYYDEEEFAYDQSGWFCTGDIGFLYDRQLVITGRKKEIIFVCGKNYYPTDVERLCCNETKIQPDKLVACGFFNTYTQTDEMGIFIVTDQTDEEFEKTKAQIKNCMISKLGVSPNHIIKVAEIPKTPGTKVARYKLIQYFLDELYPVLQHKTGKEDDSLEENIDQSYEKIEQILVNLIQEMSGADEIDIYDNFFDLGLSSFVAIALLDRLNEMFEEEIELADIYMYPSVKELSEFIREKQR